jgi:hypothetical protein
VQAPTTVSVLTADPLSGNRFAGFEPDPASWYLYTGNEFEITIGVPDAIRLLTKASRKMENWRIMKEFFW